MQHDEVRSEQAFNEVAIAKFKEFQIAIPSKNQTVLRKIFSTWVPLPKRIYHTRGGMIWDRQLIFPLSKLRIQNLFKESSVFPELKRLAAGIPISFEIESVEPLPMDIRKQALLTCLMPGEEDIHYSVFRDITPQLVKIFPCQSIMHFDDQIDFTSILREERNDKD